MPSPFPGVDPYLEAAGHWEGFHERFIIYFSDLLSERLPPHYWVSVQERITAIALPGGEREQYVADVGVSSLPSEPVEREQVRESVATLEPVPVRLRYQEPTRESFLEILRLPERELVTVLGVRSPSNKEAPGRELYHRKREVLLNQFVHLVEIDLLTKGTRLPMDEPIPTGDYHVFVSRADHRPISDVYSWGVRHPLPEIRVPVKDPDPDVRIDLAALWKQAFDRGRYTDVLDYKSDPPAFLKPADREWAKGLVAGRG